MPLAGGPRASPLSLFRATHARRAWDAKSSVVVIKDVLYATGANR